MSEKMDSPSITPVTALDRRDSGFCDESTLPNKGGSTPALQVLSTVQQVARGKDVHDFTKTEDRSWLVADLGDVHRQHQMWKQRLPRVVPFYAIKCNPDVAVLKLLAELGCGFDCASMPEIQTVFSQTRVSPHRIIYAHPCKPISHLRYAAHHQVHQTTFDNVDELFKIAEHAPKAELYLRIVTDDTNSLCKFSKKFGATSNTYALLRKAKELNLNVVGVSFHVGSASSDPQAFVKALTDAKRVFAEGESLGFGFHTLDIGGGFISQNFIETAAIINPLLEEYFEDHIRIIAEPGRFYVDSAFTLACHVIARRVLEGEKTMIYLNDGIYSNFMAFFIDRMPDPVPNVLFPNVTGPKTQEEAKVYSVWGQTADGVDRISETWKTNEEVKVGDWLYFKNMRSYSWCSAAPFNGFSDEFAIHYVNSEPTIDHVVKGICQVI